jgi:hypothetical protein
MKCRNQQYKLYTSVIAVLLVAVSTAQLSSIVPYNGTVVYAYSNSQAQSLSNDCDVIDSSCQNSGPQTQADGAAGSPITFQISNFGQQGTQKPTEPPAEPQPKTCQGCLKKFLSEEEQGELMELINQLPPPGSGGGGGAGHPIETLGDLCDRISQFPDETIESIEELLGPGTGSIEGMNLEQDRIDEIINCLSNIFLLE